MRRAALPLLVGARLTLSKNYLTPIKLGPAVPFLKACLVKKKKEGGAAVPFMTTGILPIEAVVLEYWCGRKTAIHEYVPYSVLGNGRELSYPNRVHLKNPPISLRRYSS